MNSIEQIIQRKDLVSISSIYSFRHSILIKKYNHDSFNGITRLGDVLTALPHGLVYKEETGMGATTLEFQTPRNSIIVEPIKITASSKAFKHGALYIGSPTKYHPVKASVKEITSYLNNKSIKFKKIVVVADSLYKVIDKLKETAFEDYFLLLDEIDSFQLDSTYRKSMEECIDFYKLFKQENRALLSATLINFSDPVLMGEPKTTLKYDVPVVREINLFITDSNKLIGGATELISSILKKDPTNKIFVAYNSVSGCFSIASYLTEKFNIPKKDIGILCSTNSKEKVGDFFKELESEELPTKINFVTSAYFTGFDIIEKYHLLSISGNRSKIHALSDKRLKQIAGRGRTGLLSETIIHDIVTDGKKSEVVTQEELIESADVQISSLKCIKKHFSKNAILKSNYDDVNERILKVLDEKGKRFVRYSRTQDPQIAYLNIDAYIENNRVRNELYIDPKALTNKLIQDGHHVHVEILIPEIRVEFKDVVKSDRSTKIKEIVEVLRNAQTEYELRNLDDPDKNFSPIQIKIIDSFKKLHKYIKTERLLNLIELTADKRDSREFDKLITSARFQIYPEGEIFKSRVLKYFKVGHKIQPKEILKRWKLIINELNLTLTMTTDIQAVRLLNTFFVTRKIKSDASYQIVRLNPYDFEVLSTMDEIETVDEENFMRNLK